MAGPYFWVGGSGNTSDATNHWSTADGGPPNVANVPTSADNVSFTALSNATAYTVAVDATFNCKDMTWALPGTSGVPTLSGTTFNVNVFGSLTLATGMAWSISTASLQMASTTTGKTITTNGVTFSSNISFTGSGGGWTLQDNTVVSGGRTLTVSAGSFNANAKTVNTGFFVSTSGTRTVDLTNATVNVTGTSGTPLNLATTGSLTLTDTGATWNINGGTAGGALTLGFGGVTYAGTFNITAAGVISQTGGATIKVLSITSTTNKTDSFSFGANVTIAASGSLTVAGNSVVNRAFVKSGTLGTTRTISVPNTATVTLTNVDFQDIATAGTFGTWTGTSLGDFLGNSGITFDPSVSPSLTGTGTINWSTAAIWSTGKVPLPQDDVDLGNSSTATTLTADMPRLGRNITAANYLKTLSFASTPNAIAGNITLGASGTYSGTQTLSLQGRGAQTITSNGKQFPQAVTISAFGGTYTIQDNANILGVLGISTGTLALGANQIQASTITATSATGAITGTSASVVMTRAASGTIWSGGAAFGLSSFLGQITITGNVTTTLTFAGAGNANYPILNWSNTAATGTLIITGANTFADIQTSPLSPRTIQLPASTTTTVSAFSAKGSAGKILSLTSSSPGTAAILTMATGTVNADYINSTDINHPVVPDGSSWYIGANSAITSGNRWISGPAPSGVFTVSGADVVDLFITTGVVYTYGNVIHRTN